MNVRELLAFMAERGASDLHLRVPAPPMLRIDGELVAAEGTQSLGPEDVEAVLEQITTKEQRARFRQELELDFAYSVPGLARFRVNVMQQRGTLSIAFRRIPFVVPTIEQFGLPEVCKTLIMKPRGLVLVTGPTGSGKSTTLAAMIDFLNEHESRNVITIEDPVEFLHQNKKCLIAQRDLGDDTRSFANALKHALRHDPDVILVGEMRDLETIATAITAAETGHLVLSTLHTVDAVQTVDRIIDAFPPEHQRQIRLQLSQVIEGILSQTLVPRASGKGRVGVFEILVANGAVRNLIRTDKTYELPSVLQLSNRDGMQTLNQALAQLVNARTITVEEAVRKSSDPEQLQRLIHGY
ncbi:MAG TPA: type IV pilus twitching motility protein PilT [Dehalococcoidia bacterium]|nr:type IV pilus twitching motility protein PilT [Dehalococcoidia bacterium]